MSWVPKIFRPKISPPIKKIDESLYSRGFGDFQVFAHYSKALRKLYHTAFEKQIYAFQTESKAPVIIDAGANLGFNVLFWKSCWPDARIIAIEPSKKPAEILQKNVSENKLTQVTVHTKALWSERTTLSFNSNERVSGSVNLEKKLPNQYEVETVPFAEILAEAGDHIDFLKIDIEGAEHHLLEEIRACLPKVQSLFIEYHGFISAPQNLSDYLKMLEENGFRYHVEGEHRLSSPLMNPLNNYNQDLQVAIWAYRRK